MNSCVLHYANENDNNKEWIYKHYFILFSVNIMTSKSLSNNRNNIIMVNIYIIWELNKCIIKRTNEYL